MLSRNENHIYRIRASPPDYYAGTAGGNKQLLVVPMFSSFIAMFFDSEGGFERADRSPGNDIDQYLKLVSYTEGLIQVRRFFLDDVHVGIHDFPAIFADMLQRPSKYSEDEVAVAKSELDRWTKQGVFELCLDAESNRWIEETGMVESS